MKYPEAIPFKQREHATERMGDYFVPGEDRSVVVGIFNPDDTYTEFKAKEFVDKDAPSPNSSQTHEEWSRTGVETYVVQNHQRPYYTTIPIVEVSPPLNSEDRQRAAAVIGAEILAKFDNPLSPSTIAADLAEAGVPFGQVDVRLLTRLYE